MSHQPHPPSEEPLYNIGVVARMTDIPVATLRVWERRYDFPESARTSGGHRLYSEKEILRLRWVKARIDEGMQTGRAIRALQHLESEAPNDARPLPTAPTMRLTHVPPSALPETTLPLHTNGATLDVIHQRLAAALAVPDLQEAERILSEALALFPLENLILEVIQPTMADIGEAWHEGQISVADEHLGSNFLRHRLLMWMVTGPPPRPVPPIVLGCAPDEWHEGSLLMLGVLLRRQGWPVHYLGQAIPLPDLASFAEKMQPSAIVLVAMTEQSAHHLEEWPRWLPQAERTNQPLVCYAGRIFTLDPEWKMRVPGIYLGDTLETGLQTLQQLLTNR